MTKIYVGLIIYCREPYKFEAKNVGAFYEMQDVCIAIFNKLLEMGYIFPNEMETYNDNFIQDTKQEFAEEEKEFTEEDEDEDAKEVRLKEKITSYYRNTIITEEDLVSICNKFGDLFNECWNYKIDNVKLHKRKPAYVLK
jgi:hypothetical protein